MLFGFLAFLAGAITVFAPCVLPLLPVIIGGSVSGKTRDKRRPLIIAASLAVSLLIFTLLLKATTLLINVPPQFFTIISGSIVILLGLLLLFPTMYDKLILLLNLQPMSQRLLAKSTGKGATINAVIVGAALGPVFSSCSPVYAYIVATILPVNLSMAILYMLWYIVGLSTMLLLIGYLGQRLIGRIKFLANPTGWFMRTIAVMFVAVGLLIITGYDKQLQLYISEKTPFNFDSISSQLIPRNASAQIISDGVLNVAPYPAPDFAGITSWLNTKPLQLSELRGKVVLVDFFTYSCINCIRTQPYLKQWYDNYKDSGFEIIGVHAPEFAFEKVTSNVADAVKKAGLTYPVALDNNFSTWNAYDNKYWPASYLIDQNGNVRRYHAGEGDYKETEEAIRTLLQEKGAYVPAPITASTNDSIRLSNKQTPETYLGLDRASMYVGATAFGRGTRVFTPATVTQVNQWTLGGEWTIAPEGIRAGKRALLQIRVAAKDVYLVTGNQNNGATINVSLNSTPISQKGAGGVDIRDSLLTLEKARLYSVATFNEFTTDALLTFQVPPGVQLNAFTFGS